MLPDREQRELAREINARLPADTRVNFYRVKQTETGDVVYGMLMQHGNRRHHLEQLAPWHDVESVLSQVRGWVDRSWRHRDNWGIATSIDDYA